MMLSGTKTICSGYGNESQGANCNITSHALLEEKKQCVVQDAVQLIIAPKNVKLSTIELDTRSTV